MCDLHYTNYKEKNTFPLPFLSLFSHWSHILLFFHFFQILLVEFYMKSPFSFFIKCSLIYKKNLHIYNAIQCYLYNYYINTITYNKKILTNIVNNNFKLIFSFHLLLFFVNNKHCIYCKLQINSLYE